MEPPSTSFTSFKAPVSSAPKDGIISNSNTGFKFTPQSSVASAQKGYSAHTFTGSKQAVQAFGSNASAPNTSFKSSSSDKKDFLPEQPNKPATKPISFSFQPKSDNSTAASTSGSINENKRPPTQFGIATRSPTKKEEDVKPAFGQFKMSSFSFGASPSSSSAQTQEKMSTTQTKDAVFKPLESFNVESSSVVKKSKSEENVVNVPKSFANRPDDDQTTQAPASKKRHFQDIEISIEIQPSSLQLQPSSSTKPSESILDTQSDSKPSSSFGLSKSNFNSPHKPKPAAFGAPKPTPNPDTALTFGILQRLQHTGSPYVFKHKPTGFTAPLHGAFLVCRCPVLLELQVVRDLETFDCDQSSIACLFRYIFEDRYSHQSINSLLDVIQLARLCRLELFETFLIEKELPELLANMTDLQATEIVKKMLKAANEHSLLLILKTIQRYKFLEISDLLSLVVDMLLDQPEKLKAAIKEISVPKKEQYSPFSHVKAFGELPTQLRMICPTKDLPKPPLADFEIEVDDGSSIMAIHCHVCILASRVAHFAGLFLREQPPNRLKISASHNSVLSTLEFVYTGVVSKLLDSEEVCWDVLSRIKWGLAFESQFAPLIQHCEKVSRFHPESNYDVFDLIESCQRGSVEEQKAIVRFSKRLDVIFRNPELQAKFDALPMATQISILKQPYLNQV